MDLVDIDKVLDDLELNEDNKDRPAVAAPTIRSTSVESGKGKKNGAVFVYIHCITPSQNSRIIGIFVFALLFVCFITYHGGPN